MEVEKLWLQQKDAFLQCAKKAKDEQELLSQYQELLEQIKMQTIACHPNDKILRQQIILLFQEASLAAEILYVKGTPTIQYETVNEWESFSFLRKLFRTSIPLFAELSVGLAYTLAFGGKKMPFSGYCALFFGIAVMLVILGIFAAEKEKPELPAAKSVLKADCLEQYISSQMRLIDQHIADLELLLQDATTPLLEGTLDSKTLALCQTAWAVSNAVCPGKAVLFQADALLKKNGITWMEYTPEKRSCFEIMPTKKDARTVYPALQNISDGSLVCKGQYLQKVE